MPKDIRRIVFTNDEVTKAIQDYGGGQNMEIPPGKVIKLTLSERDSQTGAIKSDKHSAFLENYNIDGQNQSVIITFHDSSALEKKNQYLTTNTEFVTAALIDYCLNHPEIKIPKNGKKNIAKTEFNLCLDIFFDLSTEGTDPAFELED